MAYPKHAEKAAAKRGTVSTKEFAKAAGTAAVAAASQLPAAKALKAAKWALKAAKRAGNAKKIASLKKKVSLLSKKGKTTTPKFRKSPVNRYHRDMDKRNPSKARDTAKELRKAQAKERKYWEDRGHYRTPDNPSEAAMGSSGTARGGGTGLRKGTGNSGVEGIAYRWDPSIATKQGTNLVGGVKATKSAAKKAAKKTKSSTKTTEFKPKTRQKKRKTGYEPDRKPEKTSRRTRERTPVEKKARQKAIELKRK